MREPPRDRVQDLFDGAVVLPAAERGAYLEAGCAGDARLRAEVESLLACDAGFPEGVARELLKSPLVRSPAVSTSPGQLVSLSMSKAGRYRIVRLIAEGGMGAVYEAEQESTGHRVALKVVRPGVASESLLDRFRQEARILGRLHHPGIAQVYEAGLSDDGRPFFAMEFIRGQHLDEYSREQSLTIPDRLELVARVCDAVQHAHEQGVIHRDLKPANILVEESGRPRVLDFGVARATDADLLTGAGLTRTGQMLGTPNYVSPEQLSADPAAIDHRADIYALGVVLYELLARHLPYRLENRSLADVSRLILEEEPPGLGSIHPELRGELATIVAKAMDKAPTRRYASAADLAADLRRFVAHEPILAKPPSALYYVRKFVRRHKGLVGGVAATGAALIVGLIGTTLFALAEARQRDRAEQHARTAIDEKREAEWQAYRARMAAAAAALSVHDVADARRQLDAAPEALRGWEWRHLHCQLDHSTSAMVLSEAVGAFLIGAPDRLRLGTINSAGLRLTDIEGGTPTTVPLSPVHGNRVTAAETSRGLRVARWVGPTTVELVDETGKVLCRTDLPNAGQPEPIAVSPDGTRLATHWAEGDWRRVAVFDATSGKLTSVCDGHRDGIWGLTFSPDGRTLASAGEDRAAHLWDATTGKRIATCQGHTSKVLSVAFRPDGARLVTTASDGTVRQWDTRTGQEVESPYDRHSGEVAAAVYSPDGQRLASAGTDRAIRLWQATGRQELGVLHGHTGSVVQMAFAPGGRRLASLSLTWVFSLGDDNVRTWNVDPRASLPVLRGHARSVYPVAYSPDGHWLASGSWDATVRLWNAASGELNASLPHPGAVTSLAYGPDGTWMVTVNSGDDLLRVWDVATARVRKEIPGPAGSHRFVTVSADGTRLVATAYLEPTHRFHVYDLASGERLHSGDGRAMAYSPDGRWLAALAEDEKTVLLLDARTHETAARFSGHEKIVHKAVFSRDSRRLASCGRDRTVRVWQIDGGACRVMQGHTDDIFAAAFHPDGTRLATAGRDRAIWLWDLDRGEEVVRLQGHTSFVWSLAFSPDGTTLISGSGDSTVRFWDTAPLKKRYQVRREAAFSRHGAERLVDPW